MTDLLGEKQRLPVSLLGERILPAFTFIRAVIAVVVGVVSQSLEAVGASVLATLQNCFSSGARVPSAGIASYDAGGESHIIQVTS
jgi:hypothetical protein